MSKVHLVYQSYFDDDGGLGGGGSFGEPKLLKAFTTKVKARMWIAKNRTKFTPEWKYEWSIKELEVT